MREKAVKEAVKRMLKARGAWHYMPVQTGYGAAGVDFFVCYKGHFIGIETKAPGVNKITARQENVLEDIVNAGGWRIMENDTSCIRLKDVLDEIDSLESDHT